MASNPNDPTRRGAQDVHGTSTVTQTAVPIERKTNWLPWILGALALLLLILAISQCDGDEVETTKTTTTTEQTTVDTSGVVVGETAAPALTGETVPAGVAAAGAAATGDVISQIRAYLGSSEAAGRRFTFDNINFATNSAKLPADAQTTISALAKLLTANANARVRIEGYADARGPAGANAQLGAQRAEAVARALIGAGVAAERVESATGGESNPVDTNATAQGQAENRRTDVVVIAK